MVGLKIEARQADGEKTLVVYVYDEIGFFGVQASDVVPAIRETDADRIEVRINSPGGDAFDGLAIYQALKDAPVPVATYNDALAGSAASLIMVAGDERYIAPEAETFIHNAMTIAFGNHNDLREVADRLEKVSTRMLGIYREATGLDEETLRAMMDADTIMEADESIEFNFATARTRDAVDAKALAVYDFAGKDPHGGEAEKPKQEEPARVTHADAGRALRLRQAKAFQLSEGIK